MITRRFILLCVLVAAVAGLLVLTGHGPHAIGYLPYAFLLACPLMHMFMHKGHHHHGADSSANHSAGAVRRSA